MSGTSCEKSPMSPYRVAAEIEKKIKPTRFQNFIDWWKDEDHYGPIVIIAGIIILFGTLLIRGIIDTREVAKHGVLVCKQDHYVETKYPAIGLRKIICLSSTGEEKHIFEEINEM